MGRTGCGKTTILEAICGLRRIRSGRVLLRRRDVTNCRPAERNLGYVPQDGALFSTLTVREHLAFPLRIRRAGRHLIAERIEEMSSLLGIGHLLNRKPLGLSGGEAQRVALGRALSFHPAILCLDEPMSAVDEATRHELYDLLKSIQRRTQVTVLHVTHSQNEAKRLGECVLKLDNGRVVQL
jgi:ABC-type sugar transport system ATPase subunit